jgi:hypothetical protein
VLVAPAEGTTIVDQAPVLTWMPVVGADGYSVRWATRPDFSDGRTDGTTGTSYTIPVDGPSYLVNRLPENEFVTVYWQVRAEPGNGLGVYSEPRTFRFYHYVPEWLAEGGGIVEVAYDGDQSPCPDPDSLDDYGCAYGLPGNTVWHDGNVNDDYYVTGGGGFGDLLRLSRYVAAAGPDHFEMRFTEEGGYGVYLFDAPFTITHVPFELWNVGTTPDDPSDDVRMIPFINPNAEQVTDWADAFTGTEGEFGSPRLCGGAPCPITEWVYWMMPDRPDGYDRFEEAALAFGGPGAVYDTTGAGGGNGADGDDRLGLNPMTGARCANQGAYVDWCYRLDQLDPTSPDIGLEFVYPIGRMVLADLAQDGTTPPEGTVIRLYTNPRLDPAYWFADPLDGPDPPPPPDEEPPAAFALGPPQPNPFRARAVVPFDVPEAGGRVRLAVYDVLGREVAVLVDAEVEAGTHEAALEGARLASGVYVVVLEGAGGRLNRKLTLLR